VPPLEYCGLKIARAREHRDTLAKYVADTFAVEANRLRARTRFEPDSSESILYVSYMPDLSKFLSQCSIILGDALYALRSALDHLAYQLAFLDTGGKIQDPCRIQFPICDTPSAFTKEEKDRLKEVDPAHIKIIETFQEYPGVGTDRPLSELRKLSNQEKHRLPIDIVVPLSSLEGVTHPQTSAAFVFGAVQQFLQTGSPIVFERAKLGAVIMRRKVPSAPPPDEETTCYVASNIAFDGDRLVFDALDKIVATVEDVIRAFEPVFRQA